MTPDEILELADIAARCQRRRLRPGAFLPREEFEDWRSAAAYGIIKAMRRTPDAAPAYYYGAARRELLCWLFREWWRNPPIRPEGGEASSVERWEPDEAQIAMLREWLSATNRKQGAKGGPGRRRAAIVERDLQILIFICRGWGSAAIAQEMGLPYDHIHKYRQALIERLGRIMKEEYQNGDTMEIG